MSTIKFSFQFNQMVMDEEPLTFGILENQIVYKKNAYLLNPAPCYLLV